LVADFNGDGRLDVVLGQSAIGGYLLYVNDSAELSVNGRPLPPLGLETQIVGNSATLRWGPGSDVETPAALLTYSVRVGRTEGGNEVFSGATPVGPGNVRSSLTKELADLPDGEYYWSVQSVDSGLTKSEWSSEQLFRVDGTPPEIKLSTPLDGASVGQRSVAVKGIVVDRLSGIMDLSIGGELVPVAQDGSFEKDVVLNEGHSIIRIVATDKAGNMTEKTISVKYVRATVLEIQIGSKMMSVNGSSVPIDVAPVIVEGRTLLPIRWVAEPFGAAVVWDADEKKVGVSLGSRTVELWIGRNGATVNGVATPIDASDPKVVPIIISGRTFLPLRFVAENLGLQVTWDASTRTVTVTN
jgi:hypothetical protein